MVIIHLGTRSSYSVPESNPRAKLSMFVIGYGGAIRMLRLDLMMNVGDENSDYCRSSPGGFR